MHGLVPFREIQSHLQKLLHDHGLSSTGIYRGWSAAARRTFRASGDCGEEISERFESLDRTRNKEELTSGSRSRGGGGSHRSGTASGRAPTSTNLNPVPPPM